MFVWLLSAAMAQTCDVVGTIDCSTMRVFDEPVATSPSEFDAYQCAAGSLGAVGAEKIWKLDLSDAQGKVSIDILRSSWWDGEAIILEGGCSPDQCLGSTLGGDVISFIPDPGVEYWLVVENGAEGDVINLEVSCLPAPGSGSDDEEPEEAEGCGGSAALVFWPACLLLGRRRR